MADPVDSSDGPSPDDARLECRRFRVSGRVQGVFFRASAQTVARDLGLGGHAVNLPDGKVEVLASGPAASLDELQRWLAEGPAMANVESVEADTEPYREIRDFTTG